MKDRTKRVIGVVVVVALIAGAGIALKATTDSGETKVGVCVIGVDSPCNGEQWDGDTDRKPPDVVVKVVRLAEKLSTLV